MDKKLKILVLHFLSEHGNSLAENGCNDLDVSLFDFLTEKEKEKLLADFNSWKTMDMMEDSVKSIEYILDYQLVRFLQSNVNDIEVIES